MIDLYAKNTLKLFGLCCKNICVPLNTYYTQKYIFPLESVRK